MPMASQDAFRQRLKEAIDAVFSGNVLAAAEGLGVLQPTLHKILTGKTRDSKQSTISLLAERLGVSEAWLRGASDTVVGYRPSGGPQAHDLVIAYFTRQTSKYRKWLAGIGKPKTRAGKKILDAFWAWDEDFIKKGMEGPYPERDVILACLDSDPTADSREHLPSEHLDWLRAAMAEDIALYRLVVSSLKRLGETPRHVRGKKLD
jgi:hypothetical protein